jgi:CHAT domain-containing protein
LVNLDGPALAFAPSATVLLRSCLGRPSRGGAAGALALGYNDPQGQPLRYAEAEAHHVAGLLGGAAIAGPQPKRERLLSEARQARWLHFSGHAIYNPRDPLDSELRTGQGESLSARAIVGELDLDADLVTLSACTSGVSQVVAGDELLGLQRAFLYAGARAVLCTLWEAADFVALLLMDRFYADLRRGQPPAAALRDAQARLRAMTGRDLVATLDRWRAEEPQFVAALGELPEIAEDQLDQQLYADPTWWAPFLLVGKAD